MRVRSGVLLLLLTLLPSLSRAADTPGADERLKALESKLTDLEFQLDQVRKSNDDVLFWLRLSDVAEIDKVSIAGPPNPRGKERYGIERAAPDALRPVRLRPEEARPVEEAPGRRPSARRRER